MNEHEFVEIEEIADHFSASVSWVYKYLIPHIDSIANDSIYSDHVKLYDFDATLEYVANNIRCEVYSVPLKGGDTVAHSDYRAWKRPPRVRLKMVTEVYSHVLSGEQLMTIEDVANDYCGSDNREAAYRYIYDNAWFAIVFGNKTWYIPRDGEFDTVAPAIVALRGAKPVAYTRGGRKKSATDKTVQTKVSCPDIAYGGRAEEINALLDAPLP